MSIESNLHCLMAKFVLQLNFMSNATNALVNSNVVC